MNHYIPKFAAEYTFVEFDSVGIKGLIKKVIKFERTTFPGVFNLAFGDKKKNYEDFDDQIVTDNGDTEKVLATIAFAVAIFTEHYPDAWIYATGSTRARNRLYQMGINR